MDTTYMYDLDGSSKCVKPDRQPRRRRSFAGFVRRRHSIFLKFGRRRAKNGGDCRSAGGLDELDCSHRSRSSARSLIVVQGSDEFTVESSIQGDRLAIEECPAEDQTPPVRNSLSVEVIDESIRSGMTQVTLEDSVSTHCPVRCSTSSTLQLKTSFEQPTVSFGTIEIREFPCILGDNPAVTSGPPLAIDWAYDPGTVVVTDVDSYERSKTSSRQKFEMLVPRSIREEWLMVVGYSRRDIDEAIKGIDGVKEGRRRSLHQGALLHRAIAIKMLTKRSRGRPSFREL